VTRVLVVEDERPIRFLVASVLRQQGHVVVEAVNGAEALRHIEEDPTFALIITDYLMPELDGGQLTQAVRQQFPDLPVLIISAHQQGEKEAMEKGATSFLGKPFSHTKLLLAVRKFL
jgi:two-component system, OmpR family, KDP operon response regulator KdpE